MRNIVLNIIRKMVWLEGFLVLVCVICIAGQYFSRRSAENRSADWQRTDAQMMDGVQTVGREQTADSVQAASAAGSEHSTETQKASVESGELQKKIAITFDDGPNPDYTEMLLAGLKERGVHATFFLLGKEVERYPEIVKKIHEDGHLIGTHSYEHVNLCNLTDAAAVSQVKKTNNAIYEVIGECPEYIRPPFGCWKSNLDYETKMIEVLWDIDPTDWKTSNADVVTARVVKKAQENDIILLHDASKSSVEAAFRIIDQLQEEGYVFVTVDEILFD